MSVVVVGCGDVGRRLAARYRAIGQPVTGIVRTAESAAALAPAGVQALTLDLDQQAPPAALLEGAVVHYHAPPPREGTRDPRLQRLLASARSAPPARLVYISTSAVYGDCQGRWIDETAPLAPRTDRGRRRLDAERQLAEFAETTGTEIIVLRVPGIYGPGRLPVARLQAGTPLVLPAQCPPTNRIHADDLAGACLAAAQHGRAGRAYNVSDGNPTSMTDYFLQVADLLGLPRPPLVTLAEARQQLSPMLMSFLEESKRLDNTRLREELGLLLRYPTLAEGLPSCLT